MNVCNYLPATCNAILYLWFFCCCNCVGLGALGRLGHSVNPPYCIINWLELIVADASRSRGKLALKCYVLSKGKDCRQREGTVHKEEITVTRMGIVCTGITLSPEGLDSRHWDETDFFCCCNETAATGMRFWLQR